MVRHAHAAHMPHRLPPNPATSTHRGLLRFAPPAYPARVLILAAFTQHTAHLLVAVINGSLPLCVFDDHFGILRLPRVAGGLTPPYLRLLTGATTCQRHLLEHYSAALSTSPPVVTVPPGLPHSLRHPPPCSPPVIPTHPFVVRCCRSQVYLGFVFPRCLSRRLPVARRIVLVGTHYSGHELIPCFTVFCCKPRAALRDDNYTALYPLTHTPVPVVWWLTLDTDPIDQCYYY